jgi:hypothetical protein
MATTDNLRKVLGPGLVELVEASSILSLDIKRLQQKSVPVKKLRGRNDAYSLEITENSVYGAIYIGELASDLDKALYLAHESYHVLHGKTPSVPDPRRLSRRRYVSRALQEETRALIHEAKVCLELVDAGYRLSYKHLFYLTTYLRGGYAAIRVLLELDVSADGHSTYAELFGRRYDTEVRRLKRSRTLLRSIA